MSEEGGDHGVLPCGHPLQQGPCWAHAPPRDHHPRRRHPLAAGDDHKDLDDGGAEDARRMGAGWGSRAGWGLCARWASIAATALDLRVGCDAGAGEDGARPRVWRCGATGLG
jgi:hypothetical protein